MLISRRPFVEIPKSSVEISNRDLTCRNCGSTIEAGGKFLLQEEINQNGFKQRISYCKNCGMNNLSFKSVHLSRTMLDLTSRNSGEYSGPKEQEDGPIRIKRREDMRNQDIENPARGLEQKNESNGI